MSTQKKFNVQSNTKKVIAPSSFTPSSQVKTGLNLKVNPIKIVVGIFLVMFGAVVWFLFAAKSVFVNANPEYAQVKVTKGIHFTIDDHFLFLPGEYQLELTALGYHNLSYQLTVNEEQNQIKTVEMVPLPGHLNIKINDDVVGQVIIDGQNVGTTSEQIRNVEAGSHDISIVTDMYQAFSQTIEVTGLDKEQDFSFALVPAWGDLSLNSSPVNASVFVDDQLIGQTPFNGQILQGEHQIKLVADGYKLWQDEFSITAQSSLDLGLVNLEVADGKMSLTSTPSGASVTIDGEYKGTTPLSMDLTPKTNYQVTLFKNGYQSKQDSFSIESGQNKSMDIKLDPILGDVFVNASEDGALLYVNGQLIGRADQTIQLPSKPHTITVKKDGYVDFTSEVLPRAGLKQTVIAKLKTIEQARWENTPELLTLKAGPKLKLFKPEATFTMGASRREQGRRANETQYKVSLSKPFYAGVMEITNEQFKRFQRSHSSGHFKGNTLDASNYPVVNISWAQAALYCNWLSQQEGLQPFYQVTEGVVTGMNMNSEGFRLLTEAEWSYLARYDQGQMKKYAWGNSLPPAPNSGNFADRSGASILGNIQAQYDDGKIVSTRVGSFNPNQHGLYDMAGNVAEWINDFYQISNGFSFKALEDPMGPEQGDFHVIRGASWALGTVSELRLSFRDYGNDARKDVGFRIARFVK